MRTLLHLLLVVSLSCGLVACGNKGSLKSPKQIAADEQKKERQKAKVTEEKPADPAAAPVQEPK